MVAKPKKKAAPRTGTRGKPNRKPQQNKRGGHHGIVRDERGQEQPKDKARAQHVSRVDRGGDPPGKKV